MTQRSSAALKLFFETGDKPTQGQFADFIESYLNTIDKGPASTRNFSEQANATTAGTGSEQLGSTFVVPANTLDTDGQLLRISAWGELVSNANTKIIGIEWGGIGHSVQLNVDEVNLSFWKMEVLLMRRTENIQDIIVAVDFSRSTLDLGVPRPGLNSDTGARDLTANQNLNIEAQTPNSAGDLTLNSWLVEILR